MSNAKNPMRDMADGRKDLYTFDPEKLVIIVDPNHPLYDERATMPVDENMVLNIMFYGVLQPILYRTEEIDGVLQPVVVAGRQRVKAAREANKRLAARGEPTLQVPGMVRRANDGDAIGLLVSENEVRLNDEIMVKAAKARRMIEKYGYDEEKAALTFGVSVATLNRYMSVEGADPEVREAFVKGEIPMGAAVEIAKLPPSKQKTAVAEVKAKASEKAARLEEKAARKGGKGKADEAPPASDKAANDAPPASEPKAKGSKVAGAAATVAKTVVAAAGVKTAHREHLRSIKQVRALQEYLGKEIPNAKDREVYDAIVTTLEWVAGKDQLDISLLLEKLQMTLPKGASDKLAPPEGSTPRAWGPSQGSLPYKVVFAWRTSQHHAAQAARK